MNKLGTNYDNTTGGGTTLDFFFNCQVDTDFICSTWRDYSGNGESNIDISATFNEPNDIYRFNYFQRNDYNENSLIYLKDFRIKFKKNDDTVIVKEFTAKKPGFSATIGRHQISTHEIFKLDTPITNVVEVNIGFINTYANQYHHDDYLNNAEYGNVGGNIIFYTYALPDIWAIYDRKNIEICKLLVRHHIKFYHLI